MAGRGIPRRYSNQTVNTDWFSKTDKAAILFLSRQEVLSRQAVLDPDIIVKALDGNTKSNGFTGGKRSSGQGDDPTVPQIKLNWNPRAKRKPGQVLKLHASYRELTSKEGADWGWVDPPRPMSKAEKDSSWNNFIEEYKKRPKPILRFFANGPDGKPTKNLVKEMEVTPFGLVDRELDGSSVPVQAKSDNFSLLSSKALKELLSTTQITGLQEKRLGRTIRELMPSQRLDLARAISRGLVVDADGKMRCPPGTPNANQFTDITMSNCMSVSPAEAIGRFRRWANNINARADQINTERRVEEMVGGIQERFDKARENINTREGSKQRQDEIDIVNEKFLRELRDANGLSIDERLTAAGFNLNNRDDIEIIETTNARHLMGLEILREQGEGPEWRGLVEDMVTVVEDPNNPANITYKTFTWNRNKSFKDNISEYNKSVKSSTFALMANQLLGTHDFGNGVQERVFLRDLLNPRILAELRDKRPDMIGRSQEYVNFMINANTSVRKGHLKALIDSRNDNPELFKGIAEIRAYTPGMGDFLTTQGMLIPLPASTARGKPAGVSLNLALNSWSRVLKPLLESEAITAISEELTKTNPYGVSVEMDFESIQSLKMSEQMKLTAFEELLDDSMDADLYTRSIKAIPENDIEKRVAGIIAALRGRSGVEIRDMLEGYGITGYKMPSGADLVKLQQELAKRLGVTPEVVQNAWLKFSRVSMYGADMSAARAYRVNGNLLDAIFEKRASHDAYHEFGHAMQYQSAQTFIKDFATQNGGFPIFENGRMVRMLPADTDQWTSYQWNDAVLAMVTKNPEWMQNWPPSGVSEMEGKMIHLLAGAYYQDEIREWFNLGGGNTQPGLQVALTEAHVELHALRKTGVIKGPEIDEMLEYMDKAIPGNRGTPRDFDTPKKPDPTPDTPTPDDGPPEIGPGPKPDPTPDSPTPRKPKPDKPGGGGTKITIGDTVINNSGNTTVTVIGDNNITVNTGDIIVGPIILPDGTVYDGDSPINVTVNVNINIPEAGSSSKKRKRPPKKRTPTRPPGVDVPEGGAPGQDTPDTPRPETRAEKASRDLWKRINGYIAEDNASEWKVAPTARGLRPGNDRSQQKTFIDEVFDLTADDTSVGGAGDAVADPFGSTQAYKSMSPDQLDARYDKINSQVRDLIDQSRARTLTKDEQAKIWLGLKGMRQIIRENQERAQYSDAKRAAVAASKRQPDQRPGKYLSKTDGTSSVLSTKTATSVRRRSLDKARSLRGDDVVEIDEDELIHHQRSITKHAGRATNGKDGWSVLDSEYEAGKAMEVASHVVTDMPASKTKDGKARAVRPNAPTSPASYGEATRAKTEALLDEDELKAVSSDIPFDDRQSVAALLGPDEMANVLKRSAASRKTGEMGGEKPQKGSPDVESPLFDEEITSAIGPSLRALDKSFIDQDVEAHIGVPSDDAMDMFGDTGAGEIIELTGLPRAKMVSYADSENLGSGELQATRRIRIIAPAGSRGLTQKNLTDGSTDDIIFPPGEFVVTDIDEDGTITLIPHRQQTSEQTLEQMIKDIDDVLAGDLSADERSEAKKARVAALSELRKSQISVQEAPGPIGSKSTTRGVSGDIGAAKRGRSRNVSLSKEYSESGSKPFSPDELFVRANTAGRIDGSGSATPLFPPAQRSQILRQNVDSLLESVAQMGELIDSIGTDDERPLPDSITPQIREMFATLSPNEIADRVANTLLDFHNGFDDRIRIDMDTTALADLMENGRIRTFSEIRPNSSATQVRESFETAVGFSPDTNPGSRTVSGRIVHRSGESITAETLRSQSKNALTGKPQNLSSMKGGKEAIEIVAIPEVAQRSSYSRGSAIKDRDALSPILSQDKNDALTALSDPLWDDAEARIKEISRVLNAGMINRPETLLGSGDGQDGLGSRGFEAVIPGGIDFTEIDEIRIPASMLQSTDSNTFDSLIDRSRDLRMALSENGFTPEQTRKVADMIDSGELADLIPSAEIARQRNGAKSLSETFTATHGKAIKLRFTRQDGVDIMNDRGFNAFPGVEAVATADEALAYRSAVEVATNHGKIKERISGSKSSTKRASSAMTVNDALIITGSKSSTAGVGKSRRRAGVAARVIGSDRTRKLLERAGLSEENAEVTQFVGELAAAFSLGGPGGLAAVFARRGARDLADIGLREAIDRGWLSPDQASRVEQQLLDRVAPEGLPERLTEAIQKGTEIATSEATRERAREVADAAREFIQENEALSGAADRARDIGESVSERTRTAGRSIRERLGRGRAQRNEAPSIEQTPSSSPFDDPFSDVSTGAQATPSFDPFATDVDPFADAGSSTPSTSGSPASTDDPFGFDPFAMETPTNDPFDSQTGAIQGSRSSTRKVTGPGGGVRSTTPNAKRQRRVEEIFEGVQSKGAGKLHEATVDELKELGLVRTKKTGIADGKPVYEAGTPEAAAALLALGYNVELGEGARAVETKLAIVALEKDLKKYFESRGDLTDEQRASFIIDACKMYVSGTNFFCGENIGTERMDMPQVSGRTSGDATYAARAAKAGLVKTKWEPGKRDADGKKRDLTPEEMAEFEALKARHPAKGKTIADPLSPEEKERFYELVDWNDTEVDLVDEWVEHMRDAYGREDIIVELDGVDPAQFTASQSQIQAEKVAGMAGGIRENYDAFVAFAESQGVKRGTPEFFSLRDKWLAGKLETKIPILDKDGNQAIDDKTGKPKFANAWWAQGYIITSNDNYVVDGHHRWAAVRLINESLPENEKLYINTRQVDTSIFEALNTAKAMQDTMGIKQAKLGKENPFKPNASAPEMTPDEWRQILSEHTDVLPSKVQDLKERGIYSPRGAIESAEGRQETLAEGLRYFGGSSSGVARDVRTETPTDDTSDPGISAIEGSRSSTSRSPMRDVVSDIGPKADRALQAIEDAVPESQRGAFNKLKERLQNLNSGDYTKMIAALSAIYSKSSLPGAAKLKEIFGGKIQELLDNPQMLKMIIDALGFLKNDSRSGGGSTPSRMEIARIIGKLLAMFASGKKSLNDDTLSQETQDLLGELFVAMIQSPDSIVIEIEEQQ